MNAGLPFVFDECRGGRHGECPADVRMAGLDIATCSCDCHKDPIMAHCDYCNAHYPLPEDTYYAIERALNAGLPAFAVVWPAHDGGTPDYSKEPLHACRYGQEIEFDG